MYCLRTIIKIKNIQLCMCMGNMGKKIEIKYLVIQTCFMNIIRESITLEFQ